MTLLIKNPNIGLSVWDTKSLVNNRNIIPDFHSFDHRQSFQSKKMLLDFSSEQSKFITNKNSTYNPLHINPLYKIFDHVLHHSKHHPQKNDKLICEAQRRIVHPFTIEEISSELQIKCNILTIVCINQENIKSNVYSFIDEEETVKRDLSPHFMFMLENDVKKNIKLIPSDLILMNPNREAMEDILIISYFHES